MNKFNQSKNYLFFNLEKSWILTIFLVDSRFGQNFFPPKNIFCSKMILSAKKYFFCSKMIFFRPQNIYCSKMIFSTKKYFFAQKWFFRLKHLFFCSKIIFSSKKDFCLPKYFFRPKIFFSATNIFFGQNLLPKVDFLIKYRLNIL